MLALLQQIKSRVRRISWKLLIQSGGGFTKAETSQPQQGRRCELITQNVTYLHMGAMVCMH